MKQKKFCKKLKNCKDRSKYDPKKEDVKHLMRGIKKESYEKEKIRESI